MRLCQLKTLDPGYIDIAEHLFDNANRSTDPSRENPCVVQAKDGSTALHWAVLNGHKALINMFVEKSPKEYILRSTTQYNHLLGDVGTNPIELALRKGFDDIAAILEAHVCVIFMNEIPIHLSC